MSTVREIFRKRKMRKLLRETNPHGGTMTTATTDPRQCERNPKIGIVIILVLITTNYFWTSISNVFELDYFSSTQWKQQQRPVSSSISTTESTSIFNTNISSSTTASENNSIMATTTKEIIDDKKIQANKKCQEPSVLSSIIKAATASATHAPTTSTSPSRPTVIITIRIACIGDSLTQGNIPPVVFGKDDYPSQLQELLLNYTTTTTATTQNNHTVQIRYEVQNFGLNGVTASTKDTNGKHWKSAYDIQKRQYNDVIKYQAHIILMMLGTNDSQFVMTEELRNQTHHHYFRQDYANLIDTFLNNTNTPEHIQPPRMLVGITPYIIKERGHFNNTLHEQYIIPHIIDIATARYLSLVDIRSAIRNVTTPPFSLTTTNTTTNASNDDSIPNEIRSLYLGDGAHFVRKGYGLFAQTFLKSILCDNNGICDIGESCQTCPNDCGY